AGPLGTTRTRRQLDEEFSVRRSRRAIDAASPAVRIPGARRERPHILGGGARRGGEGSTAFPRESPCRTQRTVVSLPGAATAGSGSATRRGSPPWFGPPSSPPCSR